jgi:hypothetical protein
MKRAAFVYLLTIFYQLIRREDMKRRILISVLVMGLLVLGTVTAQAVSIIEDVSTDRGAICLEDSYGTTYDLDFILGPILYGVDSYGWPNFGFLFGDEMVLWMDGPGGSYQESLVYTGKWDFGTWTYDGYWVNYPGGYHGGVQMWFCGASGNSGEEPEPGLNPRVAQPGVTPDTEPEPGLNPMIAQPGAMSGMENGKDEVVHRGAICLEDSYSYTYSLDLFSGVVLYGSMVEHPFPSYGFLIGDEMVLWTDAPGSGGYNDSVAYTGKWDFGTWTYDGFWVNYSPGNSGAVQMWPCGATQTEYYAVIAGAGYTCTWSDNDAYELRDALVSQGWNPSNITMLVSTASGSIHDCTKSNIQNAIAAMASVADADDVCLFFYSGHGGHQADVAPYDESDGEDEYICPEGGYILDDELDTWMSAISGDKLVAIDSCYSGGFIKQDGFVSRCLPGLPRAEITDGFGRDLDKPGFNVHTASDENESAWGIPAFQMGLFTYYLVQGLNGLTADADSDGDVDTQEAHNYLSPLCVAYPTPANMHPQLYLGTSSPLIWVE